MKIQVPVLPRAAIAALFVLMQRERPMTALQVEADQFAMDVFAERIECQNLLPASQRIVVGAGP